jgi:hypothetical protein
VHTAPYTADEMRLGLRRPAYGEPDAITFRGMPEVVVGSDHVARRGRCLNTERGHHRANAVPLAPAGADRRGEAIWLMAGRATRPYRRRGEGYADWLTQARFSVFYAVCRSTGGGPFPGGALSSRATRPPIMLCSMSRSSKCRPECSVGRFGVAASRCLIDRCTLCNRTLARFRNPSPPDCRGDAAGGG